VRTRVDLIVWDNGRAERRLTLSDGTYKIGRGIDCDVVLDADRVSRYHADIAIAGETVFIADRSGGGNGILVKGHKREHHWIQDGDFVFVDPYVLEFKVQPVRDFETTLDEAPLPRKEIVIHAKALRGHLVILTAAGQPVHPLDEEITCIGRSPYRRLPLEDESASRKHAEIRRLGGNFVIRDMRSANGTWVNGQRVEEACLQHGDEIRVGSSVFRFELDDAVTVDIQA
jgi:pSer/pThr/pTyr-binding forkhead associated (FHA) protein